MDSLAQLALISKAKKVFESEGTFLSFPVTPLGYKKEELEFFSQVDAADLIQSKKNLHDFSTLVNLIPSDEAWLPTEARFLWDEYEQILKQGICATSTRTPEEEVDYQEAKAYLKVPAEGGILQDSPIVLVYKQYRDAHFLTEQEFMEASSTGEATNDEAEKKQWREVDEPAYREKLREIENKWIVEGYKNEVEIAQSKLILLGAKSPMLTWADWQADFNPDLSSEGTSEGSRVFPSSFAPSNALEEGSWKTFSLSEVEVSALVNEAPKELRKRFSANGKASSIKSIMLEFSSATINRAWFNSELFRSRFWKLSDMTKGMISDGGMPPSGQCPSYVTAIVFARKVVVKQKHVQPTKPNKDTPMNLRFNYLAKNQQMIHRMNPVVLKAIKHRAIKNKPHVLTMERRKIPSLKPTTKRMAAQPMRAKVMARPRAVASPTLAPPILSLKSSMFTRLPTKPIKKPAPQPKKPETVPDKNIYILAFICKPLPKCPDPDPRLQW